MFKKYFLVGSVLEGESELRRYVGASLSEALKDLLGLGAIVLELYLSRRLGGNMYEIFFENPHRFYLELKNLFGAGAEHLLRNIVDWLIRKNRISGLDADEFIKLLKEDREDSRKMLLEAFKNSLRGSEDEQK